MSHSLSLFMGALCLAAFTSSTFGEPVVKPAAAPGMLGSFSVEAKPAEVQPAAAPGMLGSFSVEARPAEVQPAAAPGMLGSFSVEARPAEVQPVVAEKPVIAEKLVVAEKPVIAEKPVAKPASACVRRFSADTWPQGRMSIV